MTKTKPNGVTRRQALRSLVLNGGLACQPSRRIFESDAATFRFLARNQGGRFRLPLGECVLQIKPAEDCAVLCLELERAPVALATLVWGPNSQGALWDELLRLHNRVIQRLGYPPERRGNARPQALPWVGISLAPGFLWNAPPILVSKMLSVLWGVAYAILEVGLPDPSAN